MGLASTYIEVGPRLEHLTVAVAVVIAAAIVLAFIAVLMWRSGK